MYKTLKFSAEFANDTDRTAFKTWFQGEYSADYKDSTAVFRDSWPNTSGLYVYVEFRDPLRGDPQSGVYDIFPVLKDISARSELLKEPEYTVKELP